MKKFFITLVVLIVLAAAAFFFGWANFPVPPGAYGVVTSKTHGVDPTPVQSGEFRWIWYKLIPTNVKTAVFRLDPVKIKVDFDSSLPSADVYTRFVGLGYSDFSWDLKGEMTFALKADSIVGVTQTHNLTDQESLDKYIDGIGANIKQVILGILSSPEMTPERLENILSGSPDAAIEREVLNRFAIRDFSFVINSAKAPDFALYRQIRLIYEDFLNQQRETVSALTTTRAQANIESQLNFAELERYGELLTKYPILLDYLALRSDSR